MFRAKSLTPPSKPDVTTKTYSQRAELSKNTLAQRIFTLMDSKKTNLSVSADVATVAELLDIADKTGPYISVLKIHIDTFKFDLNTIEQLKALAKKHDFIIFEDRKFADIGQTVVAQYGEQGTFNIAEWAELTNAHGISGPDIIKGLKQAAGSRNNGLLLLAQMSSKGNLMGPDYTQAIVNMAENDEFNFVIGFICQETISKNEAFINFTPGIQFDALGDNLGQQYNTPESKIKTGTDVLIVGRGICAAKDVVAAAIKYRDAGWKAYEERCTAQLDNRSTMGMRMGATSTTS